MASKNKGYAAVLTAIFASSIISGAIVFAAVKYFDRGPSSKEFQQKVFESIDAYIKNEQDKYAQKQVDDSKPVTIEGDYSDDDAVLGDKDAPVTMVEFSDYQCPYCYAFFNDTFPQIKSEYIDTGKVKFVYRDFPIGGHSSSIPAALFAECVREQRGDDAYFTLQGELFSTIAESGFDFDKMSDYALALGVNKAKLKTCYDDQKFLGDIETDAADGRKAGVTGTPGFVIGNKLVKGALPFNKIQEIIEQQLAENQ